MWSDRQTGKGKYKQCPSNISSEDFFPFLFFSLKILFTQMISMWNFFKVLGSWSKSWSCGWFTLYLGRLCLSPRYDWAWDYKDPDQHWSATRNLSSANAISMFCGWCVSKSSLLFQFWWLVDVMDTVRLPSTSSSTSPKAYIWEQWLRRNWICSFPYPSITQTSKATFAKFLPLVPVWPLQPGNQCPEQKWAKNTAPLTAKINN